MSEKHKHGWDEGGLTDADNAYLDAKHDREREEYIAELEEEKLRQQHSIDSLSESVIGKQERIAELKAKLEHYQEQNSNLRDRLKAEERENTVAHEVINDLDAALQQGQGD